MNKLKFGKLEITIVKLQLEDNLIRMTKYKHKDDDVRGKPRHFPSISLG